VAKFNQINCKTAQTMTEPDVNESS